MTHEKKQPGRRREYLHFQAIATRWMDNDVYGHVNNVVYYSWFDTAVNRLLIDRAGLRPQGDPRGSDRGDAIGLCVESGCRYHASLAFPEMAVVGLRVGHLGRSSVRYELGVFSEGTGAEDGAHAEGFFVHVFVDRATRRPAAIPTAIRTQLAALETRLTDEFLLLDGGGGR